jgi:C4-type Zn-finger protein
MEEIKYKENEDGTTSAICPECKSSNTTYPYFDGMDRKWLVCHHCGYEVWIH